jgi:hypothetical protein
MSRLRLATEQDIPVLEAAMLANRDKEGIDFAQLPDLRNGSRVIGFVLEDTDVAGALIFRSCVEMISVSRRPAFLAEVMEHEQDIKARMRRASVTNVLTWVPQRRARSVGKLLARAGFSPVSEELRTFQIDL